ncbi:hypothetical protein CF319_g6706 [Tilletia indica]|nr:hypothetical protein CF319_g6706 [Tilletia indica]KAE8231720.1 hypothetical protein CF326_g3253 [Tilletia indica]
MASLVDWVLSFFRGLFSSKHLEICVVGLQSAGKTSLVNLLSSGQFSEEVVPTVGFNMRKVRNGNTTIKVWDIGGQPRYRTLWSRYCSGVSAIVFVVDSSLPIGPASFHALPTADGISPQALAAASAGGGSGAVAEAAATIVDPWLIAKEELHALLERPALAGIPLLVLATKNDVKGAATVEEVIRVMQLHSVTNREVSCYSISSKSQVNIDVTLRWLCARSPMGGGGLGR